MGRKIRQRVKQCLMILNCSKRSANLTARQRIQADADRAPIDSTNIGQKQQSARRQIKILASQHVGRASDAFGRRFHQSW
jgi:hypothetical protein